MKLYDVIIIGAGIVGLATAYTLLSRNQRLKLLILEKENNYAQHQTGHNSGVIHSGIYYKPGSLKAKNCKLGYEYLVNFCRKHQIKHEICGKLIVATNKEEIIQLENIYNRGLQQGLKGIERLGPEGIKALEPNVVGLEGIHVPSTGIVDFKDVADCLVNNIKLLGGEIRLGHKVISIVNNDKAEVVTSNKTFSGNYLISCAGLQSDRVAQMSNNNFSLRIIPFRGEYYILKPKRSSLIKNLVYPVPNPNFPFLGVHFTRMIHGGLEVGPNAVLSFNREGYSKYSFSLRDFFETISWPGFWKVSRKYWKVGLGEFYRSFSKKAFVQALQKLVPEVTESDLLNGEMGIRAQAFTTTGLLDDFFFVKESRCLHVCNAPSPAATSSLAIGNYIATIVEKAKGIRHSPIVGQKTF